MMAFEFWRNEKLWEFFSKEMAERFVFYVSIVENVTCKEANSDKL